MDGCGRTPTPPSGCYWCGVGERYHFQRWDAVAGWHKWAPPADWQIKARMLRRRKRTQK